MRLGDWKYMQSVKSACSMLYLELKTSILPSLKGTDKRHKMNSTIVSKTFEQLHYIRAKYDKSASQIVCNLSDMGATVQLL